MTGCGILTAAASMAIGCGPAQPAQPTVATVTWVGAEPSGRRTYAPRVTIVARTADGRTGRMSVPAHKLRCKVGDRIRATRQGVSVRLDPASCADLGRYD